MFGSGGGFGFPGASSAAHGLHRPVPALRVVAAHPPHRTADLAARRGFTGAALAAPQGLLPPGHGKRRSRQSGEGNPRAGQAVGCFSSQDPVR